MLAARKQKVAIVVFIIVGSALAVALVIYAMGKGINTFFTPTEISEGLAPTSQNIRIGGMVIVVSLE
jgi:cytochrome c-type biogenesis protein CcmE